MGSRASQGLKTLAEVTTVLGSAAEAALGARGILAALGALAGSRPLDTGAVGLRTTSTTGLRASGGHLLAHGEKTRERVMVVSDSELRAVVNYVLSPASVKVENLPWRVCCELETELEGKQLGFPVYRGQSARPRFRTVKGSFDPYAIQRNLGRPLSTAKELNTHVVSFSAPEGRVFKIHLTPGVDYVNVVRVVEGARSKIDNNEYFEKILKDLPDANIYKSGSKAYPPATAETLRAKFWELVKKENEIILNPKEIEFRSEQSSFETWNRQASKEDNATEVITIPDGPKGTSDIEVYVTGVWPRRKTYEEMTENESRTPEGGRRGRTYRTKTLRRNKHGRRLTRQSKHRRRNRHA